MKRRSFLQLITGVLFSPIVKIESRARKAGESYPCIFKKISDAITALMADGEVPDKIILNNKAYKMLQNEVYSEARILSIDNIPVICKESSFENIPKGLLLIEESARFDGLGFVYPVI